MRHDLYQFELLINVGTPSDLELELVRLSGYLGYESIFYPPLILQQTPEPQFHTQTIIPPEPLADFNIFSSYPGVWIMRYQEAGFVLTDPVVEIAVRSDLPILWSQLPQAEARHQIFDEA
ncbi:autoinducer binding domain-containing protein [Herbaspirillum huttiense]|uniref:autoinducer binding domain-containing protein n=1 Tax=Herbaspirillum huttiense TaxID=863372 RepID=UPI00382C198B